MQSKKKILIIMLGSIIINQNQNITTTIYLNTARTMPLPIFQRSYHFAKSSTGEIKLDCRNDSTWNLFSYLWDKH